MLERLRQEGFAWATVFRGAAGFGANSVTMEKVRVLRYGPAKI